MKNKIEDVLLNLGITPDLKGFDYICKAVGIIMSSSERVSLVDGIYGRVAQECGTNWQQS